MIEWKIKGQVADSLVASGGVLMEEEAKQVRVAPTLPPIAWFEYKAPESGKAYPVTFETDGHVHGYVSIWGITHISFLNKDVYTPKSQTNYSKFRTGKVLLDDGSQIATGRLTINAVHPKRMREAHNSVSAYYDDSGCAVADVTVFEDELGIFVTGAVRPEMTPEKIRIARGSDWSPDWRMFKGHLEMVGCLAVNLSGFVVDGLVASGGLGDKTADDVFVPGSSYCEVDEHGELVCFIGTAFKITEEASSAPSNLETRVSELEAIVAELRSETPVVDKLSEYKQLFFKVEGSEVTTEVVETDIEIEVLEESETE